MASADFSKKLKDLRIKSGYSQKQVYEHFKIPQSTFSSWEIGKSEPSGEMLIKLCNFYKCDMMNEFSSSDSDTVIYAELEMVRKYRKLDSAGRKEVNHVLNRELERVDVLNEANDALEKFKSMSGLNSLSTRYIQYYQKLASSGSGQIIFDSPPTDLIEIPLTPEYKKVNYAIGVSGHSMEPVYYDGDTLLIEMSNTIKKGEIGIFMVNGESYVKKLGDKELISLNPEFPNIPLIKESRCMGKVIGILE